MRGCSVISRSRISGVDSGEEEILVRDASDVLFCSCRTGKCREPHFSFKMLQKK